MPPTSEIEHRIKELSAELINHATRTHRSGRYNHRAALALMLLGFACDVAAAILGIFYDKSGKPRLHSISKSSAASHRSLDLVGRGKPVAVYFAPDKAFHTLRHSRDLDALLDRVDPATLSGSPSRWAKALAISITGCEIRLSEAGAGTTHSTGGFDFRTKSSAVSTISVSTAAPPWRYFN